MSWQAAEAVLKHSQTKGRARLLLLAIAHHAGPDGTGARPGVDTLARETKIDRREVKRLTRQMQEAGELDVKIGGGLKANQYTILLPIAPGEGAPGGISAPGVSTPSGGAHRPPQKQVVVSSVGFSLENNSIGRAQLLSELQREGVAEGVAVDLLTKFPARVLEQLAFLNDRNPRDRAATLVDSIKGNWKAPAAYVKRQQIEKDAAARREQSQRETEAQAQRAQSEAQSRAEAESEGARLDAVYEALSKAKKKALDSQVAARLELLEAPLRTDFARKMMRREVLKNSPKESQNANETD